MGDSDFAPGCARVDPTLALIEAHRLKESLSFPKTPSALSYNDLRRLVESVTYIRTADSKDQGKTEDGTFAAGMRTMPSQPFAHADTSGVGLLTW